MKKHKVIYLILLVAVLFVDYYNHARKMQPHEKEKIFKVSSKSFSKNLSYSGIIEPIKSVVIMSTADGTINEMLFHYGDKVQNGQLLFSISSEKFQSAYKAAILQYIKAKTDFFSAASQLKESSFLHRYRLISEDEFKTKKGNYYNAQLAMIQAKEELGSLLKILDLEESNIYDLNIDKIDKITQALHTYTKPQQLKIVSPNDGVILLPSRPGRNETESKKFFTGDQVKQGDVLGIIGDLRGIRIHIETDEFNVNQLKIGQKVAVSETAFPELILQGEISGIDNQGQLNRNGTPVFPVEITVNELSPEAKSHIHIGMSAKVEIHIIVPAKIIIPINAVFEKNGLTYVNVKDLKTGKIQATLVKTGATTQNSVIIESNLKDGEHIVIAD